jgi:hypothetical protein
MQRDVTTFALVARLVLAAFILRGDHSGDSSPPVPQ